MSSEINPHRQPIEWAEFLLLCKSLGLDISAPDATGRHKFTQNGKEVMHQVRKLKSGTLGSSGWFTHKFRSETESSGFPLTKGGQIWVVDTLDPNLPMDIDSQQTFIRFIEYVVEGKS
ncbi:MAG: hypothetical protein ACJA2O_004518 [Candidatus Azotimanducaceae bacterium]|jgi:hypothetical protein